MELMQRNYLCWVVLVQINLLKLRVKLDLSYRSLDHLAVRSSLAHYRRLLLLVVNDHFKQAAKLFICL